MTRILAVVFALAVLGGACGNDDAAVTTAPITTLPITTASITTVADAVTVGDVELAQTGGIEGIDVAVRITADGERSVRSRRSADGAYQPAGTVDAATLAALHDAVGRGSFLALADDPDTPPMCADGFSYALTATVDGRKVSVSFKECGTTPAPWRPVLNILTPLF